MTSPFEPYPAYKNSSIPWLGDVPAHWQVWRLKTSVHGCINGIWGNDPNGREDLPCIRVADFDRVRLRVKLARPTLRAIAPNERNRRLLKKSDLLLEKSGGGDLQPVGVVMLYDHDVEAVCSNFVARMPVSDRFDPNYLTYLHSHLYAIRLNVRSIKLTTGIQNLDSSSYLGESVAFPPFPEQAAIVRYLDHVDRRIQRHIRAKQKLIALLEEQKQAVIHQAVTGQIDVRTGRPYPAYKDSGVEWLGKVPEHWEVRRCGGVFREVVDTGYRDAELLSIDRFVGVVRQTETGRKQRASEDRSTYKRVRRGQLAYNLMNAFMGSIGVSALDGILSPAYAVAEPLGQVDTFFFHHLLRTQLYTSQFYRYSYVIMYERNRLYFDRFKQIPLLVPPYEEQKAIVVALTAASVEFSRLVECLNRQIQLVTEYRTRLIADVVTGKLDVREAAERLPDEIEEPQPHGEDEALSEPVDDAIERSEALH